MMLQSQDHKAGIFSQNQNGEVANSWTAFITFTWMLSDLREMVKLGKSIVSLIRNATFFKTSIFFQ